MNLWLRVSAGFVFLAAAVTLVGVLLGGEVAPWELAVSSGCLMVFSGFVAADFL